MWRLKGNRSHPRAMADEWVKVPLNELAAARKAKDDGLVELRWKDGWWQRPHSLGVAGNDPVDPVTDPLITKIRNSGPLARKDDGTYVVQYRECDCGEQYLVKTEHERESPRHRQWKMGGIEIEVPPQPLMGSFPPKAEKPVLELGAVIICGKCKARDKKGLDYFPDPRSKAPNYYRCQRCDGLGLVPNVGPQ